jgi:hypothetical protein
MTILLVTALLALWVLAVIVAVSLCVVSGRTDRADAGRARGLVPLRLVANR